MIRTGLPGNYPTARDAVFAAHDEHKNRTQDTRVSDSDTTVVSPTIITTPTERRHNLVSTISIQHQGITLEWVIKDPNVADKVVSALWAMIGNSGAVPIDAQTQSLPPKRRWKITPEFLAEVADLYRAAPENGKMRAVREKLNVSAPTASNYVYQARQPGLLEPSPTHGVGGRKPRAESGVWSATLTDVMENSAT